MKTNQTAAQNLPAGLFLVILLTQFHALAATITVTNLSDSGPGTLRQRIADASPGDTIDFAVTGTITLTSGELVIHTNLTISGPGATNLIISASTTGRVLRVTAGSVTLGSLTFSNSHSLSVA